MGNLKTREVTVFPKKFKSLNSLSTMHNSNIKWYKKLTRGPNV